MFASLYCQPNNMERGYLCNTWGLNSINSDTFGVRRDEEGRVRYDTQGAGMYWLTLAMKIYYFVLDVLGYIPGVSTISGAIRISLGISSWIAVEVGIREGAVIGPYIDEARGTVMGQIVRGALEMIPFYGQCANIFLDIIHTPANIHRQMAISCFPADYVNYGDDY